MLNLEFNSPKVFFPHKILCIFIDAVFLYEPLYLFHFSVITRLNSDPFSWLLYIRWWKRVSFDYKVNAAASDRVERGGLHADMHSIRMIYANYAHYSRRNVSSESARINCRKLAIKFTVQGVWGEGRRGAKDIGPPRLRLAWPASPLLGIHGC